MIYIQSTTTYGNDSKQINRIISLISCNLTCAKINDAINVAGQPRYGRTYHYRARCTSYNICQNTHMLRNTSGQLAYEQALTVYYTKSQANLSFLLLL